MNQQSQPTSLYPVERGDELDFIGLWKVVVKYKYLILFTTVVAAISAVLHVSTLPDIYRAKVLMIPVKAGGSSADSSLFLGANAPFDIINSGANIGGSAEEALLRLKTYRFLSKYIEENKIKSVLFSDQWNEVKKEWINQEPSNIEASDLLSSMISSEVDPRSRVGLTTLFVNWENPSDINKVSDLANSLAESINLVEKKRAIFEAKNNKLFLERELEKTSLTSSRSIIFRLIESEIRKIMMVNVKEESVFKIIDQALPPKQEQNKSIFAIIFIVTIFGTLLGVFMSIFINNFKRN